MKSREYKDLLETPLFMGINNQQYSEVINCLQPRQQSFLAGQVILNPDDYISKIGMVLSGTASCYYEIASGERLLLYSAKPGNFLGALCAISGESFNITVIANTNSTVVFFNSSFFSNTFDCKVRCIAHEKLTNNMLRLITEISLNLFRRTILLTMKTIRLKVCSFLLDQYNYKKNIMIILPMNRNELAIYLNITRPSLSRELHLLHKENVLSYSKNVFCILDLEKLEQYAAGLHTNDKRSN